MWLLRIIGICWMVAPVLFLFSGNMSSEIGGYAAFSFILGALLFIVSFDKVANRSDSESNTGNSEKGLKKSPQNKQENPPDTIEGLIIQRNDVSEEVDENEENKRFVNYNYSFLENKSYYPVLKIPTQGTIVKTHYPINARNRGVSEEGFEEAISFYFSKYLEIRSDIKLNTSNKTRPYIPDIALIDHSERNIRIDIEIDEPYSGISRIPTHCKGDDLFRDQYFVDRGWIVVRFTEHQIITQQQNCLHLIAALLNSIDNFFVIPESLIRLKLPQPEGFWDTLQAKKWMLENYRESYLHITFEAEEHIIENERVFTMQDELEESEVVHSFNEAPTNNDIIHYRDNSIQFFENSHRYIVNNVNFISVSTLISRFFREFDPDEAIERMMNGPNWTPEHRYYDMSPDVIKELWRLNGEEQAFLGQNIHKQIENFFNDEPYENDDVFHLFESFLNDHPNLTPYKTEWRIYDEEFHIAGTVDLISQDGEYFDMYDWKRSKNIVDMETFEPIDFNQWNNGFGILNHMDDTDYNKYCLQLSAYKYILEKNYDIEIRNMYLVVLHPNYDTYHKLDVRYLENEIEQMLNAL